MSLTNRKTEAADLRSRYPIFVQLGLIASLGLLIIVLSLNLTSEASFEIVEVVHEQIQIEEIQQTQQIDTPPPPPQPPPPIEVPDDMIDEQIDLDFNTDLDLSQAPPPPPPPPPPPGPDPEPQRVIEETIFEVVEQEPVPIGGLEGIQSRVEYPEMARRAGIEGRVFVQFVVGPDGVPRDLQVIRSLCPACDEAAMRAIRDTRFEPGRQRGQPVSVRYSIPITFRLR